MQPGISRASDMLEQSESLAGILPCTHAAIFLNDTHGEIAFAYAKSWFLIDAVSVISTRRPRARAPERPPRARPWPASVGGAAPGRDGRCGG